MKNQQVNFVPPVFLNSDWSKEMIDANAEQTYVQSYRVCRFQFIRIYHTLIHGFHYIPEVKDGFNDCAILHIGPAVCHWYAGNELGPNSDGWISRPMLSQEKLPRPL